MSGTFLAVPGCGDVEAPTYRPWHGSHHPDISAADGEPLLALLRKEHPPGSPWPWGFNYVADEADRRVRVHTEGGHRPPLRGNGSATIYETWAKANP